MTETARATTRMAWWQKLVVTLIVVPVLGTVIGALWGALLLVWRWAL